MDNKLKELLGQIPQRYTSTPDQVYDNFWQVINLLQSSGTYSHLAYSDICYVDWVKYEECFGEPYASYTPKSGNGINLFFKDDHAIICNTSPKSKKCFITVASSTREMSSAILENITSLISSEPEGQDMAAVGFWYATAAGANRSEEKLVVPGWKAIKPNYNSKAKDALDKLVTMKKHLDSSGKLLLLHGPPGTGKTTLLRSIAKEWEDWCITECILDPENFFSNPGYMMQVILNDDNRSFRLKEDGDEDAKWKLIILEDCDELISGDAKKNTGQAMSRLLNLADGMLGQGKKIIIAITTNEDIATLHPAVVRPGRCLAQIEVGTFGYDEATEWLGTSKRLSGPKTLAELYAIKNSTGPIEGIEEELQNTGMYL